VRLRNAEVPRGAGAGQVLFLDGQGAGLAGDMLVAALADLGVPFGETAGGVAALGLPGVQVALEAVERSAVAAPRFLVREEGRQPMRDYRAVRRLLLGARAFPEGARRLALRAFQRLAQAEAAVHGVPEDDVHFHEVGAVDSIVDIAAVAVALDYLGPSRIVVSPLPMGRGIVRGAAHGPLPNPAPATLGILCAAKIPTFDAGCDFELVTPTGACLVAAAASGSCAWPDMVPASVGYGAGTRDLTDRANLCRAVLGEPWARGPGGGHDERGEHSHSPSHGHGHGHGHGHDGGGAHGSGG